MRVLLAAALLLSAVLAAGAQAAPPRLSAERGDAAAIVDEGGRQVLLRGVNVNQLGDYYQADPALPTTIPLTERDFEQIAALGFNVVRLVMNWSAFQPERGAFDEAYVARVREAVRWAAAHDLYVVLDMHQDAWGKHIATPPGEPCPPGFGPAVGWDGAPLWATFTDGLSTCRANNTRELSQAVAQAFESFYADREGIQTELVATWGRIAAAFANEPNVVGYDLLNEPHPGFKVGVNQSGPLGRYYARAIEEIRAREEAQPSPTATAVSAAEPRIAFFEPSVLWSGLGDDTTPPPDFTSDRHIVFAPHLYSESISVDQGRDLDRGGLRQRRARGRGVPGAAVVGRVGLVRPAGGEPRAARALHRAGGRAADRRRVVGVEAGVRRPARRRLPRRVGQPEPDRVPERPAARARHRLHRPAAARLSRASPPAG
jgi:endoglycosylceramidase